MKTKAEENELRTALILLAATPPAGDPDTAAGTSNVLQLVVLVVLSQSQYYTTQ